MNELIAKPANPRRSPPQVIKAELTESGIMRVECTERQAAEMDAVFGSLSPAFRDIARAEILNIVQANKSKEPTDISASLNSVLAMLSGIAPQTELEAMLGLQMIAAHFSAMRSTNRHNYADTLEQLTAHGNMANKFMRTFTAQMEALGRHRRGGKQIVEHVHVNAGGQAVFAEVVNTGGSK